MTLQEFGAVVTRRIPTPAEFVAAVRGQGWSVALKPDGSAALRVPDARDRLALALAKMLAREPYRTNVLALVRQEQAAPAGTAVAARPAKRMRFYRMQSGVVLKRVEESPQPPPFGAVEQSGDAAGPWEPLPGRWVAGNDGKAEWRED